MANHIRDIDYKSTQKEEIHIERKYAQRKDIYEEVTHMKRG